MAQFIVRNLEENIKAGLKRRAEKHGNSMEEEVRQILRNAVKQESIPSPRLGSRISARFRKTGLKEDLPEFHGQAVKPADFSA